MKEEGVYVVRPKMVLAHDEEGRRIEIEQERRVLNTDLHEIAEAFIEFAREQGFDFWK